MTTEIYVQNKFALKEFYLNQFPNVIGQGEVGFEIVIDLGILVQIWPHVLAREIFIQLFFIFYNSILVSFTHGIWIGKKKNFFILTISHVNIFHSSFNHLAQYEKVKG